MTYVSGTPYVNSAGVPVMKYVAKNHFKKIIDVWNFGWDDETETVPPSAINKAVIEQTDRTKLIIHYIQPHWPYIGETKIWVHSRIKRPLFTLGKPYKERKHILPKWRDVSLATLRRAYSENVSIVLEAVSKLIPYLKGKVVITSDHGELLGEHIKFFHPCTINHPVLREVPWFEVK